ncbi:MAG: hypothetical protein K5912_03515 [Alphaproteobacteria bacterium]|nr:hypothetical protein [Alphaproteobacteria bacterium]
MQKNIVKDISFDKHDGHAKVSFMDTNYRITLPQNHIINENGQMLLKPGDTFITLQDYNEFEVAYVYNKHFYPYWITESARVLINNLLFLDRLVYAHALRREIWQMHKIPSLFAFRNLQRLLKNNFITTNVK